MLSLVSACFSICFVDTPYMNLVGLYFFLLPLSIHHKYLYYVNVGSVWEHGQSMVKRQVAFMLVTVMMQQSKTALYELYTLLLPLADNRYVKSISERILCLS